jgi:hypothetical protein
MSRSVFFLFATFGAGAACRDEVEKKTSQGGSSYCLRNPPANAWGMDQVAI